MKPLYLLPALAIVIYFLKNKSSSQMGRLDILKGGLADKRNQFEFDPLQVKKGVAVEMEHTNDPNIALEIALDHLAEFPDYYDRLEKMERR